MKRERGFSSNCEQDGECNQVEWNLEIERGGEEMRIAKCAFMVALMAVLVGCGVIYSQQEYGPVRNVPITPGKTTLIDVINMVGSPSFSAKTGADQVYCFESVKAFQILSVYGKVEKKDLVIVVDSNGVVKNQMVVATGEGQTIVGLGMWPVFEME